MTSRKVKHILGKQEVKQKLKARGFRTAAAYARMIHVHRATATRLITGEIGGELRMRFAKFLGVPEETLPRKSGTQISTD